MILFSPSHRHPPVTIPLELTGNADDLDRILGEFYWLCRELVRKNIPFVIEAHTGQGLLTLQVENHLQLDRVLCRLLCTPIRAEGESCG